MKDIELPPLPDADVYTSTALIGYRYSYSAILMQSYARAAVEADRAQRVPDGWANLLKAAREVLSWTQAADRPPVRDEFECGRMTGVRVHALADLHEAVQVLASTPAPAQQECWCETCDLAQGNPLGRTRMSLCPECGDKRCPRAKHHDNACAQHQEPPQPVERKPMTDEIVRLAGVVLNEMPHPVTNWQSAAKKVCEAVAAIKEQT